MKAAAKSQYLPALGGGLACAGLRLFLYAFGFDSRGLLESAHPLHLICLAIALAVTAYTVYAAKEKSPAPLLPGRKASGAAQLLAAVCALIHAAALWAQAADRLTMLWAAVSFAAAWAMGAVASLHYLGKKPHFLLHCVICIALAVNLVCRYRPWSGDPQLPDYLFQVLACGALTLACYQQGAFQVGLGSKQQHLFFSRMAVFFSIPSLFGSGAFWFYLAGILWMVSQEPTAPAEAKEEPHAAS